MLNIHGQELEDLSNSSSTIKISSRQENLFCLQLFWRIRNIWEMELENICISAHHKYAPRALALIWLVLRADPLEHLPGGWCGPVDLPSTYTGTGCSLSIVIQYQGREAERPPGPAGIIYINYQFMQSFSAHNNLPLVRWCISKKFQHLEFKLPKLSPLPDKK